MNMTLTFALGDNGCMGVVAILWLCYIFYDSTVVLLVSNGLKITCLCLIKVKVGLSGFEKKYHVTHHNST